MCILYIFIPYNTICSTLYISNTLKEMCSVFTYNTLLIILRTHVIGYVVEYYA